MDITASDDLGLGIDGLAQRAGADCMPYDILFEIFHYATSPATVRLGSPSTTMILARLSTTWYSHISSSPKFWCNILVDYEDWSPYNARLLTKFAHVHLERSGDKPISVWTTGSARPDPEFLSYPIQNLWTPFIGRIQNLTLAFPATWINSFWEAAPSFSAMPSLESLALSYYSTSEYFDIFNETPIDAPRLRNFAINYVYSGMGCTERVAGRSSPVLPQLPWNELTELHLAHIMFSRQDIYSVLRQCISLDVCTVTVTTGKQLTDWIMHWPRGTAIIIRSNIRTLTIHNPSNADYDRYLGHVSFPLLENLTIINNGVATTPDARSDPARAWNPMMFATFMARCSCTLRYLSISARIKGAHIHDALERSPSLVEFDVKDGLFLSPTTVKMMLNNEIGSSLEVLHCSIARDMLTDFLDMLDCRYVPPRRRRPGCYSGIRSVTIHSDQDEGCGQVHDRLESLRMDGLHVRIVTQLTYRVFAQYIPAT